MGRSLAKKSGIPEGECQINWGRLRKGTIGVMDWIALTQYSP